MAELLRLEKVSSGYGETVVLENIDLKLAESGTLAIIGRNGVGKTTLLATIMGHTRLHGGAIRFGGLDLAGRPGHERAVAGIGYVPQEREIFASLTVEENLTVAARPGPWTAERVYELFPRLAQRRRNRGNQLSGGEQQMLSIGRALTVNPKLLLMDEPLEGLAPVIVEQLLAAMERLRETGGFSIVLVEQHTRIALAFAQRTVVLDRGRVVFDGPSGELAGDPERLAKLIGVAGQPGQLHPAAEG
ncbi:MAG: ABC transporter ATP-binding protein [Alphaproteobacteria bacterium]|nr:ABC transporter ATP-binding protein [Alphaproteobacteria bacterium]